eukprot:Protomagalhaensia_sp_Gyna_25__5467@NODE_720_length_2773_cov_104_752743_g148_i2_p2_GENE_NODE_720_length_2773_cov_104_752743_g148_i2NODE_720_length_2773_cov_104_752743_g148_i2_p2_ORF_typecomplete_len153_score15_95RNase_P_Rpp14/PF01900_19/5_6e12_NODE_720_length_2773_cov_104_752743_g148_i276534
MVRTKQRWTTIRLSCEQDVEFESLSRRKHIDKNRLSSVLGERRQRWHGIEASDILTAVQDCVETTFGLVGEAKLAQGVSVSYWNSTLGVFTLKTLWAHHDMIRVALLFLSRVDHISVRPQVIGDSATFVQAQRLLLRHLHEWLRDHYTLLPK